MAEEMVRVGTYSDFKAAMDQEVRKITQGFVRMGYLLKVARDTDILAESGYKTVAEFAAAEYGMNETYVSRFIGINDRYSEGGYSDRLQEKYQGYGMSLLAEMLTLPESIADAIPQGVTRQEIREIKREYEAEQKITPMEVMLEGQQEGQEEIGMTGMAMRKYFYLHREQFSSLAPVIAREEYSEDSVERVMEVLAPSGVAVLMVRVQGIGRLMISIRGKDQDVEVQNVRSLDKEVRTWVEFLYTLKLVYAGVDLSDPEAAWEQVYGEPYREKEPEKPSEPEQKAKITEETSKITEESEKEQEEDSGEQEEAAAEKPGIAPAQESKGNEVNTVSNADPEAAYEQCTECRFHYPESPARAMAYEAVCKDCDDAEHFQARPAESTEKKNHPEYLPDGMEPEKTEAAVDGEPVHAQVEPTEGQVKEDALAYISMIQGNIGIENYRKAREQGEHLLVILKRLEGYRS